ncbi:MAG: hypothetical protein Q9218_005412 [Villophora microphyllina]
MRLQLTIQRHGLPPARVLWTTDLTGPLTGSETTISQLLEQINDIIPLESTDWGLEDYTVEIGGFEIRPLSTSDLRFRKASGRHQISVDGRHLIDGVAFGRPFLRRAERPAIRIPPRKRRRLTYDETTDDESFVGQQQVVVRGHFDDQEESEADSDYHEGQASTSENENDLESELVDILTDPDADRQYSPPAAAAESSHSGTPRRRSSRRVNGLGLKTPSLLVDENGIPFPGDYDNPLLDFFADDEPAQAQGLSTSAGKVSNQPTAASKQHQHGRADIVERIQRTKNGEKPRRSSKSVRFDETELATPATILLGANDSSDESDNVSFEPFEDEVGEISESDKENATPGARIRVARPGLAAESDLSSSSESESESEQTSSSGSSDLSTSSSEDENDGPIEEPLGSSFDDSESTSSAASSSSESSPSSEDLLPPQKAKVSKQAAKSSIPRAEGSNVDRPITAQQPVSPGAGKRVTRMRNQRRREQKKLLSLQNAGRLPPNAKIDDLRLMDVDTEDGPEADAAALAEAAADQSEATLFEAKRQALLQAISSGGVDVQDDEAVQDSADVLLHQSTKTSPDQTAKQGSNTTVAAVEKSVSSASERTLVDISFPPSTGRDVSRESLDDQTARPKVGDLRTTKEQTTSQDDAFAHANQSADGQTMPSAQKPRMRLDMVSSRRLLFGALGHRAPKTKEEEALLQVKLTKDAKSSKMPQSYMANDNGSSGKPVPSEDFDSWMDKIELSAVECCYDGVELSTPPFPFVQRWDPQQQTGYFASNYGRPHNSKKRKRNNQHYEASFEPLDEAEASKRQQLPSSSMKKRFEDNDYTASIEAVQEPAHHMSDDNVQAANDQLLRETEETVEDVPTAIDAFEDLPGLPNDPSTCLDLKRSACSTGAVIAFKQLDMSAETNWAPVISKYRTALIDSVLDDGTLSLRLAPRDLPQQEKQYDEETGERVYSKFEMPGYGENESNDGNGLLELALVDLIDPKLVRAAEEALRACAPDEVLVDATPDGHEAIESNDSTVMRGGQQPVPAADIIQDSVGGTDTLPDETEVSEEYREKYSNMMKEASWHSSVQSNGSIFKVTSETQQTAPELQKTQVSQDTNYDGPSSPHSDGFSSSPPAGDYQEAMDLVVYPALKSPSSPTAIQDETTMDLDQDHTAADSSSQIDREAVRALREDLEKEILQPVLPVMDSDRDSSHPSSRPQVTSSPAHPVRSISPPLRRRGGALSHSLLDTIPDSQPPPQASGGTTTQASNGTSTSFEPPQSSSNAPQAPHPPSDSPSSDDEFPSLESVLTSFSSQHASIKPETHSDDDGEGNTSLLFHDLPSHSQTNRNARASPKSNSNSNRSKAKSKGFDVEPTKVAKTDNDAYKPPSSSAPARLTKFKPPRKTSVDFDKPAKTKKTKEKSKMSKRFDPAPPSSQDYIGTQVVDLTRSSDPVNLEEDHVDGVGSMGSASQGSSLPKGPGLVSKMKKGMGKVR